MFWTSPAYASIRLAVSPILLLVVDFILGVGSGKGGRYEILCIPKPWVPYLSRHS